MKRWFLFAILAGLVTAPFLKRKRAAGTSVIALTSDLRYDIEDYLGDRL